MKIRYMKDKAWRQLNLKYEETSIHSYMYISINANFKILFWHKYETNEQNYRI